MILPAKINSKIHFSFLSMLLINLCCVRDAQGEINKYMLGYNYTNRKVQCTTLGFVGVGLCIMFLFYNKNPKKINNKPKVLEREEDIEFQQTSNQPIILNSYNILNGSTSQDGKESLFFTALFNKQNIAFIALSLQNPPPTNPLRENRFCTLKQLNIADEYKEVQSDIIISACLKHIITYATENQCQSITMSYTNEQSEKNNMHSVKQIFEKYQFVNISQRKYSIMIYKNQLIDIPKKNNRLPTSRVKT